MMRPGGRISPESRPRLLETKRLVGMVIVLKSKMPPRGRGASIDRRICKRYGTVAACTALLLLFLAAQLSEGSPRAWITELLLGHEAAGTARSQQRAQWRKAREDRVASLI